MMGTHKLSSQELLAFLEADFPQVSSYNFSIDSLVDDTIIVSMIAGPEHLRPGGTVSGPTMFALADVAAYLIILAHIGEVASAVTTSLTINFIRKPEPAKMRAVCKLIKLGKRLALCEIHIQSGDNNDIVAQASATYSIPD